MVLVDDENLCPSLIFAAIKEYSLYASVVKQVIILLEFLTSFAAFSTDLVLIDYFRSVDRRHETRACKTDVANTAADLSETPIRS